MPTTLTGLVLFAALLLPGFVYVTVRERAVPRRERSVFRETIEIAVVSIAGISAAAVVLAAVSSKWPDQTPDLERLIGQDLAYVADEYIIVGGWFVGLLAATTAAAGGFAWWRRRRMVHPSISSSWWRLFDTLRESTWEVVVQCALDDGSWVKGTLSSYNNYEPETADRDLVLLDPITYQLPGKDEEEQRLDVSAACVSARRIVAMFVTYVQATPSHDPATSSRNLTSDSAVPVASAAGGPPAQPAGPAAHGHHSER
jgi:hypothetical protein